MQLSSTQFFFTDVPIQQQTVQLQKQHDVQTQKGQQTRCRWTDADKAYKT